MSFRIRADETVTRAIRRLARKQLREAAHSLEGELPLGEGIHHLRTSLKKARALAALVRPTVGRRAGRADRRLRKLAALTSDLRDAEVLVKTFDALLGTADTEPTSPSLRRARRGLEMRSRRLARAFAGDETAERLVRDLRRARRQSRRWLPRAAGKRGGWRLVRKGLVVGYRRARRSLERAYEEKSGEAFHGWRKDVKAHRYQFQLLEDIWPGESTAHVEALERLGEMLGEEHDLTVLEQVVEGDQRCFPHEEDRTRLFELIDRRRYSLRAEVHALGDRLFAEGPRAFGRRLRDELREGVHRIRKLGKQSGNESGNQTGKQSGKHKGRGHEGDVGSNGHAAHTNGHLPAWPDVTTSKPGPGGPPVSATDVV